MKHDLLETTAALALLWVPLSIVIAVTIGRIIRVRDLR